MTKYRLIDHFVINSFSLRFSKISIQMSAYPGFYISAYVKETIFYDITISKTEISIESACNGWFSKSWFRTTPSSETQRFFLFYFHCYKTDYSQTNFRSILEWIWHISFDSCFHLNLSNNYLARAPSKPLLSTEPPL